MQVVRLEAPRPDSTADLTADSTSIRPPTQPPTRREAGRRSRRGGDYGPYGYMEGQVAARSETPSPCGVIERSRYRGAQAGIAQPHACKQTPEPACITQKSLMKIGGTHTLVMRSRRSAPVLLTHLLRGSRAFHLHFSHCATEVDPCVEVELEAEERLIAPALAHW